jgi:hypothetical protein
MAADITTYKAQRSLTKEFLFQDLAIPSYITPLATLRDNSTKEFLFQDLTKIPSYITPLATLRDNSTKEFLFQDLTKIPSLIISLKRRNPKQNMPGAITRLVFDYTVISILSERLSWRTATSFWSSFC